jgi:4-diphosphocytidyl-2-C-methyl-D-erythritol kinase
MKSKIIKKLAFAKLNLGLQIINKRIDGYHNINTVFLKINFFDELEFSLSDSISIDCNVDIPAKENLVYKAAMLLKEFANCDLGANIKLKKNIPSGAGLGGGSSDAAVTLINLNELWNLNIDKNDIFELATKLGSDVPFFLDGTAALASGRGEELTYFPLELHNPIVIVIPDFSVSTPWAYKNFKLSNKPIADFRKYSELINTNPKELREYLFNDFEELVFQHYPQSAQIKQELLDSGAAFAMLSGSGSALFGVFTNIEQAKTALTQLKHFKKVLVESNNEFGIF